MDIKNLYKKAQQSADKFVKNVKSTDLDKQSTCSQWSVRDLLNHMVNETLWVPALLAGKTIAEVGSIYDGDVLGDDFLKAWQEASQKGLEAVEKLDDLGKITHLSMGDMSASEYLSQIIFDKVIHGWDVAKSTGQEDSLDEELVRWVYDKFSPQAEQFRKWGVVGKEVEVPENAPLQTKLLAILGRVR